MGGYVACVEAGINRARLLCEPTFIPAATPAVGDVLTRTDSPVATDFTMNVPLGLEGRPKVNHLFV